MTYKTYEELEENTPYDENETSFEWGKSAWNESEKATEERLTKKQFEIFARLGSYVKIGNLLKCGRARARIAMISLGIKFKKEDK